MKTKTKIIISVIALFSVVESPGQDTISHYNRFPAGISIEYGIGNYSLKDEFISKEKYSGTLPYFSLGWAQEHNKIAYRLNLEYRHSNNLKNNNVTSDLKQFALKQGFLYPLKKATLFKKDLFIWLGPTADIFIYFNEPNIAYSGINLAMSFAGLISVGFDADFVYPLSDKFQLESTVYLSVLSLGFRMIEFGSSDETAIKLLTSFTGLNSYFNLGVRYYIIERLSVRLYYKFEYMRISAWAPVHSASDNLILGLSYRF